MCNISAVNGTKRFQLANDLFGAPHQQNKNKDGKIFGQWFVEKADLETFDQMEKENN